MKEKKKKKKKKKKKTDWLLKDVFLANNHEY